MQRMRGWPPLVFRFSYSQPGLYYTVFMGSIQMQRKSLFCYTSRNCFSLWGCGGKLFQLDMKANSAQAFSEAPRQFTPLCVYSSVNSKTLKSCSTTLASCLACISSNKLSKCYCKGEEQQLIGNTLTIDHAVSLRVAIKARIFHVQCTLYSIAPPYLY